MHTNRCYHTATLLPNGKVLVVGGNGGLSSAELYDPATGTWTMTGALAAGREYHTATLLPNGMVLVVGGDSTQVSQPPNPLTYLASAELYNPDTGQWTPAGAMSHARCEHTATLLPNGQVLVAGGSGAYSTASTAELYDPAAGTWTPTGALKAARRRIRQRCCRMARCWRSGARVPSCRRRARAPNYTTPPQGHGPAPANLTPTAMLTARPCCPTGRCSSPAAAAAPRPALFPALNSTTPPLACGRRPAT